MTQFKESELKKLLHFVGYGNRNAPFWFVGMEERGSKKRLRRRLNFRRFEDLKRAHKILGIKDYHWTKSKLQPTWKRMCWLMLALNHQNFDDKQLVLDYQAERLGRKKDETFLLELMPLPAKNLKSWDLHELFKSRSEYKRKVRPKRIKLLNRLLRKHQPEKVVICYGRWWGRHKEIFENADFHSTGKFAVAKTEYGLIILCDHLTMIGTEKIMEMQEIIEANKG